jgi:hypothetical protein
MYHHQVLTPCTCKLLPAGRIIVHSVRVRLASDVIKYYCLAEKLICSFGARI